MYEKTYQKVQALIRNYGGDWRRDRLSGGRVRHSLLFDLPGMEDPMGVYVDILPDQETAESYGYISNRGEAIRVNYTSKPMLFAERQALAWLAHWLKDRIVVNRMASRYHGKV